MYSLKDKEGTIINNVREDFFKEYDCRKLIGNIDFSVAIPKNGKELFSEVEYVLWAEAKQGNKHNIYDAFVQLIFTIGKERTIDKHLPPKFLGVFDAEKIAFIPYTAVMGIFTQHDFNWNVAPSDHETKEFQQLKEIVRRELDSTAKDADNVFVFYFGNHDRELRKFIKKNFVSGRDNIHRMRINQNNFTHIYEKWRNEVMKTIDVDWKNAKKHGLLDADFYLADLIADNNITLKDGLKVLLKSDHYNLKERLNNDDLYRNGVFEIKFTDKMKAHTLFWSRYDRPPKKEYWDKIVERKDLLVPQDIRETKGSYYTPRIWVEKSQEYLADVLGENWQDEYYIWDCCAGTGNLLAGLKNKMNIWASELFDSNVRVMHDRIDEKGNSSFLLKSHVFQFDFLNDDFSKLPQNLQDIINDPEKRKKLVVYINPPYKEHSNARTKQGEQPQTGVAKNSQIYDRFQKSVGTATRELYIQFFLRIFKDIQGCVLASFSTVKFVNSQNFIKFRKFFKAEYKKGFICPSNTFDNVQGKFPIGFTIWKLNEKEEISDITTTVLDKYADNIGVKTFYAEYTNDRYISNWLRSYYLKNQPQDSEIAYIILPGVDMQSQGGVYFTLKPGESDVKQHKLAPIYKDNFIPMAIYLAIRHAVELTWVNNKDQFLYPNDGWRFDKDFQNDCLAYTLFHGQNKITSAEGINHWIPFKELEVNAPDNFKSHFMSDFIAGKLAPKNSDTLFGMEESLVPSEPITFTPAAQAVMDAGRKIWQYYFQKAKNSTTLYGNEDVNVNVSFYDIRAFFQGSSNGRMNSDSDDPTYMSLLKELRTYQKVLAKQIEKKVYLYGFLKGEVEVDPMERLNELQKENEELKHKLHAQQTTVINQIHIDTYNDNSKHISLDKE